MKNRIDNPNIQCITVGMIKRTSFIEQLSTALRRSPVTALLGPRQCGKTTLARTFGQNRVSVYEISLQNTLRLAAGMNA
ncbi:MAG TPA: hypothetical protein PK953_12290, partial [Smithellaceae bacterium]|nr:hypothetical protein [Smithellaceae bacterium]HQC11683.1 hypothetical protein [Smithellaceae bacterium]HQH00323.1 hypothetical protein [Smithellaceae bacterium]HQJ78523.1 hypothetical protein [Smithellaceae bacterium]